MGFRRFVLLICCAVVALVAAPGVALAQDCLNGLKPALVAGGFSGSLDCRHDEISVRKVGTLRGPSQELTVYDYRYKLAPRCSSCAIHGGQRILIFERGRYKGQYMPYNVGVTTQSGRLLFWPLADAGAQRNPVAVDLTRLGLPPRILVNGEVVVFFR